MIAELNSVDSVAVSANRRVAPPLKRVAFEAQVKQAFSQIDGVLKRAGGSWTMS